MKSDRMMLAAGLLAVLSVVVSVMALMVTLRAGGGATPEELSALRDRVDYLEEELASLREKSADAEGTPVKEVFSAAAMEEQMKRLRAEVDALKSGGGARAAVAAVQERQERVLKDANRVNFKVWRETLDMNLARNGFDDEQRQRISGDYGRLLEQLEELQLRWFRGEADWSGTMDEVKMRSLEFYDTVERGADTETARRVLDIAFPTPEMKRFFFAGSGQ